VIRRWQAIKLLEDDNLVKERVAALPGGAQALETAQKCRERIYDLFQDDFEMVLTDDRYGVIEGVLKAAVTRSQRNRVDMSRTIDLVLTDRFFGIPVFIFFIWAMFQLTFSLGGLSHGVARGRSGSVVQGCGQRYARLDAQVPGS
jgi:ferrous iron transport protein B